MIVYYATLAFVVGAGSLSDVARKGRASLTSTRVAAGFAAAAGAVLVGVAALRWRVGVDYWQYEALYPKYRDEAWASLSLLGEPGIRIIARLSSWLADDPAMMLGIAAVVTVGLSVTTIYRHASSVAVGLLVYVLVGSWQLSFNAVRQQLAVAILFACHRWLLERCPWRWLGVVAVATLFHVSAAIMMLAYFVPRRRLRPLAVLGMLMAALAASFLYGLLAQILELVTEDDVGSGAYFARAVNPLRLAVAAVPLAVYAFITAKGRLSKSEHFYLNMVFIGAVVQLASIGSAYLARFVAYFSIYLTLAIPSLLKARSRRDRPPLFVGMTTMYFVYWYLNTAPEPALANYRWIFAR